MASAEKTPKAIVQMECGICLQPCQHPVKLPCGHIFCYLCTKGIANRSRACAFCRQPIPTEFLENPQVVDGASLLSDEGNDRYAWFYQAKAAGWWQYQERDSDELEQIYQKNKEAVFDRLIAGFMYVIDFKEMIQYRKTNRSVFRRIKRDQTNIGDKVGVAGLRAPGQPEQQHNAFPPRGQQRHPASSAATAPQPPGSRRSTAPLNGVQSHSGQHHTDEDETPGVPAPAMGAQRLSTTLQDQRLVFNSDDDQLCRPPRHLIDSSSDEATRLSGTMAMLSVREEQQLPDYV